MNVIRSNTSAIVAAAIGMAMTVTPVQATATALQGEAGILACNSSGPDLDDSAYTKDFAKATTIYSGPGSHCPIAGVGYPVNSIDFHCWTWGQNGTWSYLRTQNTVYGWVKDTDLIGIGAIEQC